MVRRRTRPTKITTTSAASVANASAVAHGVINGVAAAAVVANGNHLLEDQYFASPKRKDCKIDATSAAALLLLPLCQNVVLQVDDLEEGDVDPNEEALTKRCNQIKSPSPSKSTRAERAGIAGGRTIGVPLATRSQTRTIENFFKANTAAKTAKLKETEEKKTESRPPTYQQTHNNNNSHNHNQAVLADYDDSLSPPLKAEHDAPAIPADFIFDLSEDTNDTEFSEDAAVAANAIDFATHRSPPSHRDSHSSSHSSSSTNNTNNTTTTTTTENIFLQEPVLTLNVDKSPNQASSIKINKTLAIEPIFSSPPSLASVALNGRFNQIVTLSNGGGGGGGGCGGVSPVKRESFGFEAAAGSGVGSFMLLQPPDNNDNSSCDSGVAFAPSLDSSSSGGGCGGGANYQSPIALAQQQLLGQMRRRKPATPHRIVCPSPIKLVQRAVSPVGHSLSARKLSGGAFAKEGLSPRKSQRHLAAATSGGAAIVAASKTRRRLNQQKGQAPYPAMTDSVAAAVVPAAALQNGYKQTGQSNDRHFDGDVVVIDDDDDEDEHDLEFENLEDIESVIPYCGIATTNNAATAAAAKSILNSAKHPTAQQNTTNNHNNNNINQTLKAPAKTKETKAITSKAPPAQSKLKQHLQQPLAATNGNRELTDFFPVRRSVRKTKTAVKEEMMRNLELAVLEERADGLKVAHFEGKGRGIVADRRFQRGEFVVEYVGDLISMTEAGEREKGYALDENAGCYMYYFKHKNQQYCIDATLDSGKLGRLVNHSRTGNLMTKVVVVKQRPHLILIARDDIEEGDELTYDYGDRSKESLIHHPWLAF